MTADDLNIGDILITNRWSSLSPTDSIATGVPVRVVRKTTLDGYQTGLRLNLISLKRGDVMVSSIEHELSRRTEVIVELCEISDPPQEVIEI